MSYLKIDSSGEIVETNDEYGRTVSRKAPTVYSRDLYVNSTEQIDDDHKYWLHMDWQKAQEKALKQAVSIEKEKIRKDLQQDFRSRAMQDAAYGWLLKNIETDKKLEAVMQGMGSAGDFNQLAISGYGLSKDGRKGWATDYEKIVNGKQDAPPVYLSGIPSGLGHAGQLGRSRRMGHSGQLGSWLSDITGINVEATPEQEQVVYQQAQDYLTTQAQNILSPPPATTAKPVISAPSFVPPSLQAGVSVPGIGVVPKVYVYGILGAALVGSAAFFLMRRR